MATAKTPTIRKKTNKVKIKKTYNWTKLTAFSFIFAAIGTFAILFVKAQVANPYTPIAGCPTGTTTPLGQANPSMEPEPMGSIWCYNLGASPAPTRISGANSWTDDFNTNVQMTQLNDGDMDYRVWAPAGPGASLIKGKLFMNNNHWMSDTTSQGQAGTTMRPNRSFRAINGTITMEADFAPGVPDMLQNNWGEFTITTASAPTGVFSDNLYAYGQFGGHYTFGCRIHGPGVACSLEADAASHTPLSGTGATPGLRSNCWEIPDGWRLIETSWHQPCGTIHFGGENGTPAPGYPGKTLGDFKRTCQAGDMDIMCRDRWRLELSANHFVIYVNGVKYFEEGDWLPGHQLPDSFFNSDLYVYQSSWHAVSGSVTARTHWDHLAVNPEQGPSAAPSFCLNQPHSTCPVTMATSPAATPTPTTPKPSTTPPPTATPPPATPPPAPVTASDVDIIDYGFTPKDIQVKKGTRVVWSNRSKQGIAHSVTSTKGAFDSGIFSAGQSFAFTFNEPGVYPYYCIPHPSMTGTVTVLNDNGSVPAATQQPGSTPTATQQPGAVSADPLAGKPEIKTFDANMASGTSDVAPDDHVNHEVPTPSVATKLSESITAVSKQKWLLLLLIVLGVLVVVYLILRLSPIGRKLGEITARLRNRF